MKRSLAGMLTTVAMLAVGVTPAPAAMRLVDDDKRQCGSAQFTAIQPAVDAAQSGDTIVVCSGLYLEQVVIGGGEEDANEKSNLRLISQSRAGATVRSALPFALTGDPNDALVGVEVSGFRIEGPGRGIALGFARETLLADNAILSASGGIDQSDAVSSTIRNNLIRGYSGIGVEASVPSSLSLGTHADLRSNTIIGRPGSTGVRILAGSLGGGFPISSGFLFGNTIASNGATGVEIANARVDLKGNEIFSNGVGLFYNGDDMTIENNGVTNNRQQGILVVNSSGNHFTSNNARGNGGIDCEDRTAPGGSGTAGTANTWTANLGHESAPPGICKRTIP